MDKRNFQTGKNKDKSSSIILDREKKLRKRNRKTERKHLVLRAILWHLALSIKATRMY